MDDPREVRLKTPSSSPVAKPGYCQDCGARAPTKRVEFYRIIGAVIVLHYKYVSGYLCKSCVHRYFWDYTLVTLCLGWWGCLSSLLTPLVLLHNVVRYALCLRMPPAPKVQPVATWTGGAAKPIAKQQQGAKQIDVIWDVPSDANNKREHL